MAKIKTFDIECEEGVVEFGAKLSNKDFRQGRSHSGHGKCGFDKCLAKVANRKERYGVAKAIEADLMAEAMLVPEYELVATATPEPIASSRYEESEEALTPSLVYNEFTGDFEPVNSCTSTRIREDESVKTEVSTKEPRLFFSLCEMWEVTTLLAGMAASILVGVLMIACK